MANIVEDLLRIMNARMGRDVRDAIHDSIRDINNEVEGQRSIINASLEQAQASANQAETSATNASNSASQAQASATTASRSMSIAGMSSTNAKNSADSAEQFANSAHVSATSAEQFASQAIEVAETLGFKGVWDAFANTPTLTSGVGENGDTYIVSVAGTWNNMIFNVNDKIVFDGITAHDWIKLPNFGGSGGGGVNPAPIFNDGITYKVGEYVIYNGDTYRFVADKEAGVWDSTKVEQQYSMGAYVTAGKKADTVLGLCATAEGYNTEASGKYSHAEGQSTIASGNYSHAEGSFQSTMTQSYLTTASGTASHAEGYGTTASGGGAHAEGKQTTASGAYSHAEGDLTTASENSTHAEGRLTIASGQYSHAEGYNTKASERYSHAEGQSTQTGAQYQHVQGKYNVGKSTTLFEIGNGTADGARSNALEVDDDGNLKATSYSNLSSRKYKKNIKNMTEKEARKILELNPVKYDYKSELLPNNQYGLIAEDVEKIMTYPIIYENEEPDSIDYSKFIPALIKLVQIQQKQIDELIKGR